MKTIPSKQSRLFRFVTLAFFTAFAGGARFALALDLDSLQKDIERTHETVSHITGHAFQRLDANDIVVFDIRETNEFVVSHLAGAIQVNPDQDPIVFLHRHGQNVKGKTVVVYCSVGVRSTAFLSRVQDALKELGATASYNLKGGVFRWRNEDRPLQRNGSPTRLVHPFNWYWSRLVEDKDAISYSP